MYRVYIDDTYLLRYKLSGFIKNLNDEYIIDLKHNIKVSLVNTQTNKSVSIGLYNLYNNVIEGKIILANAYFLDRFHLYKSYTYPSYDLDNVFLCNSNHYKNLVNTFPKGYYYKRYAGKKELFYNDTFVCGLRGDHDAILCLSEDCEDVYLIYYLYGAEVEIRRYYRGSIVGSEILSDFNFWDMRESSSFSRVVDVWNKLKITPLERGQC